MDFGQTPGTIVDESADAIDVYAPAGAVGTAAVTVVTPGGTSAASAQFTYLTPPPVVLGLSQSSGSAAGGTTITITGTDLDGAKAVDFGTTPGQIVSDSATQITVVSPAITVAAGGTVDVTVTTAGGTSSTSPLDEFTGITAPAVTSVAAPGGAAGSIAGGPVSGGTEVLITGTSLSGATAVDFGTTAGTIVVDTDTYILALSPPALAQDGSSGPETEAITVTTPYGTSPTSSADQFTYVAAPSATAAIYTTTVDAALTVPAMPACWRTTAIRRALP